VRRYSPSRAEGASVCNAARKATALHAVGANVELTNLADLGRGLGLFDDVDDLAGGVADDTSIGKRTIYDGGQQSEMRLAKLVAVEQPTHRVGTEQRRVAIEDEQVAIEAFHGFHGHACGVSSAERLLLYNVLVSVAEVRAHFILAIANHDVDVLGSGNLERIVNYAIENGSFAEFAENQGLSIAVDGRLAGCQDNGPQAGLLLLCSHDETFL
jgi:hypothetical protein